MGNYPSAEFNPYTGTYEYNTAYQTELDRYNRRMYSNYNSYYPSMGYGQTPNYYNSYGQQQYYPSYQSPYNSVGYGAYGMGYQPSYGYNSTPQYVSSMYGSPAAYGAYNNYYPYNVQRPYM